MDETKKDKTQSAFEAAESVVMMVRRLQDNDETSLIDTIESGLILLKRLQENDDWVELHARLAEISPKESRDSFIDIRKFLLQLKADAGLMTKEKFEHAIKNEVKDNWTDDYMTNFLPKD
ncbi:unnamed protein product [marine sediment metagenome]|uniref:Uncharacterized protein n=1 Tax=marine sediment metagenome TaxID=412755 RepID=X1BLQ4_9ZZZZ